MFTLTIVGRRPWAMTFDSRHREEVAAAKAVFDETKRGGFVAYKSTQHGGFEAVTEFDANANIILIPALRGG